MKEQAKEWRLRFTVLLGLFLISGVAGLIDEVVWTRMLTRVLGTTVDATATVLASFMAGLCLGSLICGKWIDRVRKPLVWYAAIELGIACLAALTIIVLDPVRLVPLYRGLESLVGAGGWRAPARGLLALAILLPPATLMGATLPVLACFLGRRSQSLGRSAGTLYAMNTFGAVIGTISAGFVLIGTVGETNSLLIAASLNVVAAVGALVLALARDPIDEAEVPAEADESSRFVDVPAYSSWEVWAATIAFGLGGFVTLGLEVAWGRMLILYQGTSIYAFSAMLVVVLSGMALGSGLGSRWFSKRSDPLAILARVELLIGLAVLISLFLFDRLPVPRFTFMSKKSMLINWFLVPLVLLGPCAFLSGVAFPLATRCQGAIKGRAGAGVARVLYWNTFGCILGAWAAGFALIPRLGASRTAALLAAISVLVGGALIASRFGASRVRDVRPNLPWSEAVAGVAALVLFLGVSDSYRSLILERSRRASKGDLVLFKHVEDRVGATTAFGRSDGSRLGKALWVNGHGMTRLVSVTKLMAHLPLWLAEKPRNALVICLGMGTTVRSALAHPDLNVRVVELVPGVVECVKFFHNNDDSWRNNPRLTIRVDDGRNDLLMHDNSYDMITIDPAPPLYAAGTVNLYCREFVALCRDRLTPEGVMCLWLPPERFDDSLMILRAFVDVFPHAAVFSGGRIDDGLLLLGSTSSSVLGDLDTKIRRGFGSPVVVRDLTEWDGEYATPAKVISLYLGDRDLLESFAGLGPINSDDHPYTEFPLWRAVFQRDRYRRTLHSSALAAFRDRKTMTASPATKISRR